MTKQDLIEIIASFNLPIDADFRNDKLANLALTRKIEHDMRDAVVYQMYRKLLPNKIVCKEWNKIDVAIIDMHNIPELLIELKAHNSIDFPWFLIEHGKKDYPMVHDFKKLLEYRQSKYGLYYIFLNTVVKTITLLPKDPIGKETNPYRGLMNEYIYLPYKEKVLRVFKNWAYLLQLLNLPKNLTTAVEINAGTYRGVSVSVLAFIYGPFDNTNEGVLNSLVCKFPTGIEFPRPRFDQSTFDKIDLSDIDFYYEDNVLGTLGNGVRCIPIL